MEVLKLETWINEFNPQELVPDKVQEYLDFVVQAVERYDPERYSEWHHIVPRCIDPGKKFRDQGVQINGRDHFLAHKMLVDCFEGQKKYKLACAVTYTSGHLDLTPEEVEDMRKVMTAYNPTKLPEVRKKMSENHADFSGKNHPMYGVSRCGEDNPFFGRTHSEESKRKISETRIKSGIARGENNPMFGVKRYGEDNPMYGRVHSDVSRKKMSDKKIGSGNPCYGKICINNGEVNRYIPRDLEVPEGWIKGKLRKSS